MVKQSSQTSFGSGGRQSKRTSMDSTVQAQQVQPSDGTTLASPSPTAMEEQLTFFRGQTAETLSISQMPSGPGPLHLAAKLARPHPGFLNVTTAALSHTLRSGNLRRLQSLIAQGHVVDMPDQEGKTPLMYW